MGHQFDKDKMTFEQAFNILDPILNQLNFEEKSRAWRTIRKFILEIVDLKGCQTLTELEKDIYEDAYEDGFQDGWDDGYSEGKGRSCFEISKEESEPIKEKKA